MTFKILNNVPAPVTAHRYKWPFARMTIEQSLLVEFDRDWAAACKAAQTTGKRKGWRFQCRWYKNGSTETGKPHGMIWRIS